MDKALDIENLKPVLERVLQSFRLTPDDIKEERSRIPVSDRGRFTCANCEVGVTGHSYSWISAFSWLTFDLRELVVKKKWTMKCRFCLSESKPYFTKEQLESMFRKAVEIYTGEKPNRPTNIGYGARRMFRQPHLPRLCEKCEWGVSCCWNGIRAGSVPAERS